MWMIPEEMPATNNCYSTHCFVWLNRGTILHRGIWSPWLNWRMIGDWYHHVGREKSENQCRKIWKLRCRARNFDAFYNLLLNFLNLGWTISKLSGQIIGGPLNVVNFRVRNNGGSPVKVTGQLNFSSDIPNFWLVKLFSLKQSLVKYTPTNVTIFPVYSSMITKSLTVVNN
jgi:hypothetical protein